MSDARLDEVVGGLVKALHQAVLELGVTESELRAGLGFLSEVGAHDEFILLSDVLGVSVLVDRITHGEDASATASNVEGPFYVPDAPMLSPPFELASDDEPGEPLFVSGRVADAATGDPIGGALLDVWQANADGQYDVQYARDGETRLRGRLTADANGRYEFRTVVPPPYEIPKDGPVGALLRALARHAFRPAHIHAKVSAPGHASLTTMAFIAGDAYLDSDTIDAVKESLVVGLERHESAQDLADRGLDEPFSTCVFDVALRAG